jgi:hypothetical protein
MVDALVQSGAKDEGAARGRSSFPYRLSRLLPSLPSFYLPRR